MDIASHEKNKKQQKIAKAHGYRKVSKAQNWIAEAHKKISKAQAVRHFFFVCEIFKAHMLEKTNT